MKILHARRRNARPSLTCLGTAFVLASLSIGTPGAAGTDGSPAPRAQSDMLTALSASGPRASTDAQARIFDPIIGDWDFDCTIYPDKGDSYDFAGEWKFDWILDGAAIQDVWIGYKEGRAPGQRHMGTTLRFYDPKIDQWQVMFIVPISGKIIQLKGGAQGDRIVLDGIDVTGAALRWSFNDIKPDSFLWRGETSYDGGKSWRTEQIMKLRRKRTT